MSPREQGGIEDARFVRFREDDGSHRYYATYTAFDRNHILPQMIETEDFLKFRLRPLHGAAAQNKGMALFPAAWRPLRHVGPPGRREHHPHVLRRCPSTGNTMRS